MRDGEEGGEGRLGGGWGANCDNLSLFVSHLITRGGMTTVGFPKEANRLRSFSARSRSREVLQHK